MTKDTKNGSKLYFKIHKRGKIENRLALTQSHSHF